MELDAAAGGGLPGHRRCHLAGGHAGPGPGCGRSGTADHRAAGTCVDGHARPACVALAQPVRSFVDHARLRRWNGRLLRAAARAGTHTGGHPALRRDSRARPIYLAHRRDLSLHAGIENTQPARAVRSAILDGDSAPAEGARRGRCDQLRRPYHAVFAGAGAGPLDPVRGVAAAGQERHHQQQRRWRRQRDGPWRTKLRDPRHRPAAFVAGHRQRGGEQRQWRAGPGQGPGRGALRQCRATRHSGQGRQPGHDRRHRVAAQGQ